MFVVMLCVLWGYVFLLCKVVAVVGLGPFALFGAIVLACAVAMGSGS